MRIDTQQERETPEGVTLTFPVAGPPVRFIAWILDTLFIGVLQAVLAIALGLLGAVGGGLYLLCAFMLTWFYPVFFEVWKDGKTPGKQRMGLQVVMDDGTPISLAPSVIRNLLRTADFLPAAFAAGFVTMTLDRDFRRLGDLAAGTLVIHSSRPDVGDLVPVDTPVAPAVQLSNEERRTIVDFASRLPHWNFERVQELANIIRPLTKATGEEGVKKVVGIANWTLGRSEAPPAPKASAEAFPADGAPIEMASSPPLSTPASSTPPISTSPSSAPVDLKPPEAMP